MEWCLQPATRAINHFAFRCYSEIVANHSTAYKRWPVRSLLPTASSQRDFPFLSPFLFHPRLNQTPLCSSILRRTVSSPVSYPPGCFINENEGASYIFLTRCSLPIHLPLLLLSIPPFFLSFAVSSPSTVSIFLGSSHCRLNPPRICPLSLCSLSLPPLLVAVILLSVYRAGLRGMRQRVLGEINSDWYHACLGKPLVRIYEKKRKEVNVDVLIPKRK